MTGRAECEVIGRWRIVSSDLWDRDYLDLVDPASIDIGEGGRGELMFGVVTASLDLSYSRTIVFFTFEGCDEDNEVDRVGIGRTPRRRHAGNRDLVPPWRRRVLRAERGPSSTPC